MVRQIQLTPGLLPWFPTAHVPGQNHGEDRARFGIASNWPAAALVAIRIWR